MRNILLIMTIVMLAILGNFHHSYGAPPSSKTKPQPQEDQRLKTLHELFTGLGITVNPTYEDMNAYAQTHWLRKPNQERWQMEKSSYQSKLPKIIGVLTRLGMISRVDPSITNPDYAVILGATTYRMRTRMQNVLELISANKFTPKQIVILTGERPLDPVYEPKALLLNKSYIRKDWVMKGSMPTTETEAAKFIWDQLKKPDQVKNIPVVFISTPMLTKNGKLARPTTVDTIESWLKLSPKPGSIVAFSNNPYVPYQHETMKPTLNKASWFKQGGTLETVGYAFSEKEDNDNVAILLDNVARYIYSILEVEKVAAAQQ